MKGFPTLKLKKILQRHKKNPQDKELHKVIEEKEIEKKDFDKLINKGIKQEPFDKKR